MQKLKAAGAGIADRVREILPEREFLHYKSDVGMQVYRLSTRVQLACLAGLVALVSYFGVATTSLVKQAVVEMTAANEVETMRQEVASLRKAAEATTNRIEKRQKFLTTLLAGDADPSALADLMPEVAGTTANASAPEVLAPLAKIETSQLQFVTQATSAAEARFQQSQAVLKRLGIRTSRIVRQSHMGMGGPEEDEDSPLANAEPKFKALFLSWKKLDLLEKGMSAIPSFKPVKNYTYTSGYGIRYDPFNGQTAMHRGVDMSGAVGEPIYAAADGRVLRAGRMRGYGNFIEIEHGSGITTRYGHMSRLYVKRGDQVKRGEKIGGMGSTGRSTGSHLHYEVRIDNKSVNPMPFLEASDYVIAVQDRAGAAQGGPADVSAAN